MSLIHSRELFAASAFPIAVDTVVDRTLMQKEFHRHEYFEMLFVDRGVLVNRFKRGRVSMQSGNILIMKPYVLHVLEEAKNKEKNRAYCCSFLPQTADSSIHSLEELKVSNSPNKYFFNPFLSLVEEGNFAIQLKVDADQHEKLAGLFRKLRDSSHEYTERGYALTRFHFLHLLFFLAEQHAKNHVRSKTVSWELAVPASHYQAGLRKTLNHIHDHYEQPLALADMAAMSGSSKTYFCCLFKHEIGMTFLNYVNSLRIERARVLLRDTCDSALDICYQVGFNDYTHFARQFKKNMGMTPALFRKQSRHTSRMRDERENIHMVN